MKQGKVKLNTEHQTKYNEKISGIK